MSPYPVDGSCVWSLVSHHRYMSQHDLPPYLRESAADHGATFWRWLTNWIPFVGAPLGDLGARLFAGQRIDRMAEALHHVSIEQIQHADALREQKERFTARRAENQVNEPDADWVSITRAPFDLCAEPALVSRRAILSRDDYESLLAQAPNHLFTVDGRPVQSSIDFEDRTFQWGPVVSLNSMDGGFSVAPWQLDFADAQSLMSGADWAREKQMGNLVWKSMVAVIDGLIDQDLLKVWARRSSPDVPFSTIPPDSWKHYVVVDWNAGRAEAPGGNSLYSVYVALQ